MTKYKVNVVLPPITDSDVDHRELTIVTNGGTPSVTNIPPTDTNYEFLADNNDNLHLELVDVDTSGNKSQPSMRDFVVTDTIPPHQPGQLNVSVTEQVEV